MRDKNKSAARGRSVIGGPAALRPKPLAENGSYEVIVAGHLDKHWGGWLGEMEIMHDPNGNTRLVGDIPDQAALHGLLVRIRDLGLGLVSLRRI